VRKRLRKRYKPSRNGNKWGGNKGESDYDAYRGDRQQKQPGWSTCEGLTVYIENWNTKGDRMLIAGTTKKSTRALVKKAGREGVRKGGVPPG